MADPTSLVDQHGYVLLTECAWIRLGPFVAGPDPGTGERRLLVIPYPGITPYLRKGFVWKWMLVTAYGRTRLRPRTHHPAEVIEPAYKFWRALRVFGRSTTAGADALDWQDTAAWYYYRRFRKTWWWYKNRFTKRTALAVLYSTPATVSVGARSLLHDLALLAPPGSRPPTPAEVVARGRAWWGDGHPFAADETRAIAAGVWAYASEAAEADPAPRQGEMVKRVQGFLFSTPECGPEQDVARLRAAFDAVLRSLHDEKVKCPETDFSFSLLNRKNNVRRKVGKRLPGTPISEITAGEAGLGAEAFHTVSGFVSNACTWLREKLESSGLPVQIDRGTFDPWYGGHPAFGGIPAAMFDRRTGLLLPALLDLARRPGDPVIPKALARAMVAWGLLNQDRRVEDNGANARKKQTADVGTLSEADLDARKAPAPDRDEVRESPLFQHLLAGFTSTCGCPSSRLRLDGDPVTSGGRVHASLRCECGQVTVKCWKIGQLAPPHAGDGE